MTDALPTTEGHSVHGGAVQVVEHVHAQNGQQLFGFVRRLGLGDDEASDVTQEALLRLWRICVAGEPPNSAVAWTFRTAYHLAMDRHRIRRRWEGFLARQTSGRPHSVDRRDELLAIWTEVDRLPARQRQVLYLRYRADLTFEDIASILGIDASSARGSASRGMATLRDRLTTEDQ